MRLAVPFIAVVVVILVGWCVSSPRGGVDAVAEVPALSSPAAQSRPHPGRSPHTTAAVVEGGGGEGVAPHSWPEWATDDLGQLDLVAPHPSEVPCGSGDCLLEQPDRHRAETQSFLAQQALDRLLFQQGLEGAVADDLRAQMDANLAAMGWE